MAALAVDPQLYWVTTLTRSVLLPLYGGTLEQAERCFYHSHSLSRRSTTRCFAVYTQYSTNITTTICNLVQHNNHFLQNILQPFSAALSCTPESGSNVSVCRYWCKAGRRTCGWLARGNSPSPRQLASLISLPLTDMAGFLHFPAASIMLKKYFIG